MLTKREIYRTDLPHRAIAVYMYLCDRADKDGRCFPSVPTIAFDVKLSASTVKRALSDLTRGGYIACERRYREKGGNSSNVYLIK